MVINQEQSEDRAQGKVQHTTMPVAAARGLWAGLQASVKCIQYLCNAPYMEESLPELLHGW